MLGPAQESKVSKKTHTPWDFQQNSNIFSKMDLGLILGASRRAPATIAPHTGTARRGVALPQKGSVRGLDGGPGRVARHAQHGVEVAVAAQRLLPRLGLGGEQGLGGGHAHGGNRPRPSPVDPRTSPGQLQASNAVRSSAECLGPSSSVTRSAPRRWVGGSVAAPESPGTAKEHRHANWTHLFNDSASHVIVVPSVPEMWIPIATHAHHSAGTSLENFTTASCLIQTPGKKNFSAGKDCFIQQHFDWILGTS